MVYCGIGSGEFTVDCSPVWGKKMEKTILIVDDESLVWRAFARLFRLWGWSTILQAGNGEEALTLVRKQQVDLVLTDTHMPIMGGIELTKALREEGFTMPIVRMSAGDDTADFDKSSPMSELRSIIVEAMRSR